MKALPLPPRKIETAAPEPEAVIRDYRARLYRLPGWPLKFGDRP